VAFTAGSIALDRLAEMTDLFGPRLSGSVALEQVRRSRGHGGNGS